MRYCHIIPIDDEEIHFAQSTCWCNPLVEKDGIVVHNAKDCREKYERQGRPVEGKGWVLIGEEK